MRVDVLSDMYFGDCGKAKVADLLVNPPKELSSSHPSLFANYTAVARFNGGKNAGHTVYTDDGKKLVFHVVPSGVLTKGLMNIIGPGVMISLPHLLEEIEEIKARGFLIDKTNLLISDRCHIVTEDHVNQDIEKEKILNIGTTKTGMGPAFISKATRNGVRLKDVFMGIHTGLTRKDTEAFDKLKSMIGDTTQWFKSNPETVLLCEGAQGHYLDIDHGTYPYVTSTNTTAAYAFVSLGLPVTSVGRIFGVFKAYSTRVGNGSFKTELFGKEAETIRELGGEFGSTTGRPRRVGWLDLDAILEAARMNGVTDLVVTKTDIADKIDNFKIMYDDSYFNYPKGVSSAFEIEKLILRSEFTGNIWCSYGPNRNQVKILHNASE